MFLGSQAGETVSVRAQKFRGERDASVVVEKGDCATTVWHDNLRRCTVKVRNWKKILASRVPIFPGDYVPTVLTLVDL